VVVGYFSDSKKQLSQWLRELHTFVSPNTLSLPDWCDTVSFAGLNRAVRDNDSGEQLLGLLDQLGGGARHPTESIMVLPSTEARPDLAAMLAPSVLMLVGCKVCEGRSSHFSTYLDNVASTDVKKLWMKKNHVINEPLHTRAKCLVDSAENLRVVRVAFNVGAKATGLVQVGKDGNEVLVSISPQMVHVAFAGMPWAAAVPRLLREVGIIPPQVKLLSGVTTAEELERHIHGFGKVFSETLKKAQEELAAQYESMDFATRDSVASIVGIIDSVLRNTLLRNALFREANVALWSFGSFVFTLDALIKFTVLVKKPPATKPPPRPTKKVHG